MAYITDHATKRAKERLGLPKRASARNADQAYQYGIRQHETTGGLHRYIEALYWKHRTANNIRIYHGNVYIFCNKTLITIFPVPPKYRKAAEKAERNHTRKEKRP